MGLHAFGEAPAARVQVGLARLYGLVQALEQPHALVVKPHGKLAVLVRLNGAKLLRPVQVLKLRAEHCCGFTVQGLHNLMVGEGTRGEIDRLTGEGLAEGYRLAYEARSAIKSRYEDWMVVIAIAGLLAFGAIALATVQSGTLLPGPWALALILVIIAAACAPAFLLCRRHFATRLAEQDRWLARLSTPPGPGDDAASIFDLLVEVSQHAPAWLSVKQKDRFRGHPFLTTALFISAASAAYTVLIAITHRGDSSLPYVLVVLAPLVAAFVASAWAEVSAVRKEREAALVRWKERLESSRRAMEEIFGGL